MGNIFSFFFSSSKSLQIKQKKLKVIKLLGEGGFSYVYLVEDAYTKANFAVKKTLCQTPEQLQVARQELEILQKFKHPNLLKVYDYDFKPSSKIRGATEAYTIIPFYKKGTLQDGLEVRRVTKGDHDMFSEQYILTSFAALCTGVQELHSHNPPLAHNDIKPANILFTNDNKLILFDFGSVAPARHLITSRKEALKLQEWADSHCTPLFKAPELFNVASDAIIDERTDVWSLGCVLYAMAYVESPFENDSLSGSIALAVTSGQIRFPREDKRYSQEFRDLVTWMLTLDNQQRPFIDQVLERIEKINSSMSVTIDIPNEGTSSSVSRSKTPSRSVSNISNKPTKTPSSTSAISSSTKGKEQEVDQEESQEDSLNDNDNTNNDNNNNIDNNDNTNTNDNKTTASTDPNASAEESV